MKIRDLTKNILLPLFLLVLAIIPQSVHSQIIVTPAKLVSNSGETPGFYYALPRNLIKVDFIIEKTKAYKGPYSDFAAKLLGISNYIQKDEIRYSIIDVILTIETEPDPDASYYVEFDEKASKDSKSLIFNLQNDGILLSANDSDEKNPTTNLITSKTLVNNGNKSEFTYYAESNLYQKVDTIVRKITIDTTTIRRNILQSSWVDRTPEQKARAAAETISKIREARFNLISGYQEVDFGSGLAYMDSQLLDMETEYVSMFTGKEVKSIENQSVEFIPSKELTGQQNLVKFSETGGMNTTDQKAEFVQIEIFPVGNTSILAQGNKNLGNVRLTNNVYSRVPEYAKVKVLFKEKIIAEKKLLISQLGTLSVSPVNKTRLVFDAQTGMVTTVKRE